MLLGFSVAHGGQVELAWNASSGTVTGYRMFYHAEGQGYDFNNPAWEGSGTTCIITGLQSGVTYYFVVRAFNAAGMSQNSNEVPFQGKVPAKPLSINLRKEKE